MGAALKTVHHGDWLAVRQNFQRVKSVLYGPDSTPTFASLTISGLTQDSLVYGGASGTLTSLGVATDGQLPIGSTGTTPVLATLTGTANEIEVTNGPGAITLGIPDAVTLVNPTVTGTFDASAGKVLVEDAHISEPSSESDGYVGVAYISSEGRIYFAVDGVMYYVAGSVVAAPVTGNPIGLLLALTYA
jgi:hypothetical protein